MLFEDSVTIIYVDEYTHCCWKLTVYIGTFWLSPILSYSCSFLAFVGFGVEWAKVRRVQSLELHSAEWVVLLVVWWR